MIKRAKANNESIHQIRGNGGEIMTQRNNNNTMNDTSANFMYKSMSNINFNES